METSKRERCFLYDTRYIWIVDQYRIQDSIKGAEALVV